MTERVVCVDDKPKPRGWAGALLGALFVYALAAAGDL